jgi:hypothetical protein
MGARPGTVPAVFHASALKVSPERNSGKMEKRGQHHSKPDIVVPVVGIVPVANRAANVVLIIVERATTQHSVVLLGLPPQQSRARLARETSCLDTIFLESRL